MKFVVWLFRFWSVTIVQDYYRSAICKILTENSNALILWTIKHVGWTNTLAFDNHSTCWMMLDHVWYTIKQSIWHFFCFHVGCVNCCCFFLLFVLSRASCCWRARALWLQIKSLPETQSPPFLLFTWSWPKETGGSEDENGRHVTHKPVRLMLAFKSEALLLFRPLADSYSVAMFNHSYILYFYINSQICGTKTSTSQDSLFSSERRYSA